MHFRHWFYHVGKRPPYPNSPGGLRFPDGNSLYSLQQSTRGWHSSQVLSEYIQRVGLFLADFCKIKGGTFLEVQTKSEATQLRHLLVKQQQRGPRENLNPCIIRGNNSRPNQPERNSHKLLKNVTCLVMLSPHTNAKDEMLFLASRFDHVRMRTNDLRSSFRIDAAFHCPWLLKIKLHLRWNLQTSQPIGHRSTKEIEMCINRFASFTLDPFVLVLSILQIFKTYALFSLQLQLTSLLAPRGDLYINNSQQKSSQLYQTNQCTI